MLTPSTRFLLWNFDILIVSFISKNPFLGLHNKDVRQWLELSQYLRQRKLYLSTTSFIHGNVANLELIDYNTKIQSFQILG